MDVWITEDSDYPDDAITHRFYYRARHGTFRVERYPIADGTIIMSGNDDGKGSISVAVARVIEAAREVGVFMVMP